MVSRVKCPACGHEFTSPVQGGRTDTGGTSIAYRCPKCRNRIDIRDNQI